MLNADVTKEINNDSKILSTEQNTGFVGYFKHVVLFTSIYLFWALTIEYINGIVRPFTNERSKFIQVSERFVSALILVFINLVVTNLLYYGFLFITTNLKVEEAYLDVKPFIINEILH